MPVPRSPDAVRAQRKQDNTLQSMQFPSDLGDTGILLMFKEYSYQERETGRTGGVTNVQSARGKGTILDSVYLPLPEQLLDATQVKVGGQEIGILGAAAATSTDAVMESIGSGSFEPLRKALGGANAGELLTAGVAGFMREGLQLIGASGAQRGIEAGMGAVANPFQAMVFEGVDLKVFMLNWTFAPKSRAETSTIKQIIRTIKKHSLPFYKNANIAGNSIKGGRAFLSYPSVCIPLITGVNTLVFKPCMVSQIQVDYNGGGELAFLEGGDPAAVKINMTLQEMQIWTREDYTGEYVDPTISVTPANQREYF